MKRQQILLPFAVNAIITVVVAAGLTFSDPQHWAMNLLGSFIFANCIGFTIFAFIHYLDYYLAKTTLVIRITLTALMFLAGGLIGTETGVFVYDIIIGMRIVGEEHTRLLVMNLVLAGVFGSIAYLYFSLRSRAAQLAATVKEKELNEERLTRLKTKAELEALQTKINPHFLFNTLNSIASLISENPKAAEDTVEKLSELFRHSLRHAEKNSVTLEEEFDLIRTYLEIEKVRLGDRLQYEVACEEGLRKVELPAMLIQPLVENAIKHAIAPSIKGGQLTVEAKRTDGAFAILVRDSGKGFRTAGEANGFGLRSIQERLALKYAGKASLRIVEDGHTEIIITIPLS